LISTIEFQQVTPPSSTHRRTPDSVIPQRFIRQGKQEIRLQEVWVVTTKHYSQNAKTKIAEKYPSRKILFFDADWLVDLVEQHLPYYWHKLPNATGSYLATLAGQIAELDTQTSLLQAPGASSKYIELDVEEYDPEQYKKSPKRHKTRVVRFIDEVLGNKISILEAEMGYGKSRIARHLVMELTNPDVLKATRTLPVFQPFSAFSRENYDGLDKRIEGLIGEACFSEARSNGETFLLVLDGIDEASGDPDRCSEVIKKVMTETQRLENVRVLLTTRPFKLIEEISNVNKSVKRYRIRPLSIAKLIRFLQDVCAQADLPKKLYDELAKSALFRQLPQNPIAASLLSNLLSQHKQELPANLTELYSKSAEYMLGRWDEKRGLSTEKLYKACERVSRQLARYMLDNQLIYISSAEAKDIVNEYLMQRNVGVSAAEVNDYLFHRSHLFGILEDSQTMFFRHRSLAEYLYALDGYQLRNLDVENKAFHPYWVNVTFFYVGLLAECPDLLRKLASLSSKDEGPRWIRSLQLANYLLAGYQSPYAVVEDVMSGLFIEISSLYLDVKKGKTKSHLDQLPEMKLLWLFAMLVKGCYGYEFFKKALPLSMAQIDEDQMVDDEVRMYALFFAACALGEMDDLCGYQFLLTTYKTEEMPIPIALGLQCETISGSKRFLKDPLIKHHQKRLRKLLGGEKDDKGAIARKVKLDELFEKPMRAISDSRR